MIKGSSIITDRLTDIEPDRIFHDASVSSLFDK